ncbi:hypothetical protein [Bdellovibrio sp. HCB288]|uniref:hypothetical protein n=1 Tax=Bdellovibrio sp. HCB288 TaxID=3394355 RepID=UPI0039B3B434
MRAGRIDAWAAPLSYKIRFEEKDGPNQKPVRVALVLMTLNEYFAVSKQIDPELATRWKDAFQAMKKDGSYKALMEKNGFTPLP